MAATLTFAVYFLSIHPHVMSRLREEVLGKIGPTRRPTFEDMKEMKYLKAVINGEIHSEMCVRVVLNHELLETLRLLPPVYVVSLIYADFVIFRLPQLDRSMSGAHTACPFTVSH